MKTYVSLRLQWLVLIALSASTIVAPVVLVARAASETTGPVLVVAAPWANLGSIIETAGGHEVGPETAPLARFATAEDDPQAFASRLRKAGAWVVIQSAALAQLCGIAK